MNLHQRIKRLEKTISAAQRLPSVQPPLQIVVEYHNALSGKTSHCMTILMPMENRAKRSPQFRGSYDC
jgi:hypothetical protein